MPAKTRDLSSLIGSRICHDLISPLGAIGNGVELLTMSGLDGAPEIALITESVENANSRIRFFRVAFGAASDGQSLGQSEIATILAGVARNGRLRIAWDIDGTVARDEVKLTFLCLLCLETAMAWGGQISVGRRGRTWHVAGEAERLKVDPQLWEVLSNPYAEASVTSADVHFPLAAEQARRLDRAISAEISGNRIELSF